MKRAAEEEACRSSRTIPLSIVVVNYENWRDVAPLVGRLVESPALRSGVVELLVVDNASTEPPPPQLLASIPGFRLIVSRENVGFSAGVNLGWRASHGRWLLLLNPDVVAESGLPDLILGRIGEYEARPGGPPGIVGFGLRNEDGTRQPSVGAEPGLFQSLVGLFLPRDRRKYQPDHRLSPGVGVPWVTGACALVDAEILRALNGMDEEFFLYYEEVALCRSARALGRVVEYDPSVEVVHLHPLQSRRVSPPMRVIVRHSKLLFFRKFQPPWQFRALCGLIASEARVRVGIARLRGDPISRRVWEAVGLLVRDVRRDGPLRGTRVRDLAGAVLIGPAIPPKAQAGLDRVEVEQVARTSQEGTTITRSRSR